MKENMINFEVVKNELEDCGAAELFDVLWLVDI